MDDGTGVMECVKFFDASLNTPVQFRQIHLGSLVSVKGVLAIIQK